MTDELLTRPEAPLMHALIASARADDVVSPVERAFIDAALAHLGVERDDRHRYRALLLGDEPLPPLPDDAPSPDATQRAEIFGKALALSAADYELDEEERELLVALGRNFELDEATVARLIDEAAAATS